MIKSQELLTLGVTVRRTEVESIAIIVGSFRKEVKFFGSV